MAQAAVADAAVRAGASAAPTSRHDWSWMVAAVGTLVTGTSVVAMVVTGRPLSMIYGHWILHNAPTAIICLWLGHLVVRERPGHLGGVLITVLGAVSALHVGVITVADARLAAAGVGYEGRRMEPFVPAELPLDASVIAWISTWTWIPIIVIATTLLLLVFPDGHLLGPRWRGAIVAVGAAMALLMGAYMVEFRPGTTEVVVLGDTVRTDATARALMTAGALTLAAATVVSVSSLVLRWRRAGAEERVQIRSVAVLWIALALVNLLLFPFQWLWIPLSMVVIWLLLAAYALAITRYRLHGLDIVVNRATVAAVLALLLTAGYLAVVVGAGQLAGRGRDDTLVPLLAAGLVAIAFGPVRRAVQRLVDRLLYGRDQDAQQVFSALAARLRDASSPDDVLADVTHLLVRSTGAHRVEVVAVDDGAHRVVAAYGTVARPAITDTPAATPAVTPTGDQETTPAATIDGSRGPTVATSASTQHAAEPDPLWTMPVVHDGEGLGCIRVFARAASDLAPGAEDLVADVAATLGIVLRNADLTRRLQDQVEELRRSRHRLVQAHHEARRSLERDIHDGAQARLVALRLRLGLAERTAAGHDDPELERELGELAHQVDATVASLRSLSRGLQPPVLEGAGVAAALRSEARSLPVDITVHDDGSGRHDAVVEAAVYFSCLEAIHNAVRHGGARTVAVELSEATGDLEFTVRDDGCGFDPAAAQPGHGLMNLRDRITSLGGTVGVEPGAGTGTVVTGRVPCQPVVSDR